MSYRQLNLVITVAAIAVMTLSAACCVLMYTTYQPRIDELNMRLVEARQEVADKTNRIYELHLELDGRSE